MSAFTNIVWEYSTLGGRVELYGGHPTMKHHSASVRRACATASAGGAQPHKITILQPASGPTSPGFQHIKYAEYYSESNQRQIADGAILTEYSSAAGVPTGDCTTLVLIHTSKVIATHAGREGLKALSGCEACSSNVVTHALQQFTKKERRELTACIVGTIAPEHFAHPDEQGRELVQPFRTLYGDKYFYGDPADGKLDMVSYIRDICIAHGTLPEKVIWDGVDTFSNPNVMSHRQQTQQGIKECHWQRNLIIAYKT